jgi:LysR family pca operon transcriptional activator
MHATRNRRLPRPANPASDLELRHLRAFVALVEHGSVTAASQALGRAQSTISESLAALERALGASLVERQPGASANLLTAAGETLLPHAREVLAAVDKTYVAVAETAARARGAVHIVANESVSTYVLSGVLTKLRAHWPNTRFSVSVATCPDIRQGVRDGAFDVGLLLESGNRKVRRNAAADSSARFDNRQVLAPVVPLVIFATPSHPLAEGGHSKTVARSALSGFPLFVSDAAGDFHALLENFFHADHLPGPKLESTGTIEGVKRGVAADPRAFGILPIYAVRGELRAGRFTQLNLRPSPPQMSLVALLSRSRELHPGTDELIAELRRVLVASVRP